VQYGVPPSPGHGHIPTSDPCHAWPSLLSTWSVADRWRNRPAPPYPPSQHGWRCFTSSASVEMLTCPVLTVFSLSLSLSPLPLCLSLCLSVSLFLSLCLSVCLSLSLSLPLSPSLSSSLLS